jgi:serine/threonine-protein kinase
MGVVYRAEDEKLRRLVALKLLPDTSRDEERRQRFLREARSAAAVSHSNVAVVYQVDEDEGRVFIAMELVEGENLRARLNRGRLDMATALDFAEQIGRGLAAAHAIGIMHRDLKPENVMITPTGQVKLLDFGLAKLGAIQSTSGQTDAALAKTETVVTSQQGRILGTPEYMSPEQGMGGALDVRSDVFTLGVVLYELLSGTRPFSGRSAGELLVAIARDAPPLLRERAPEVDELVEAVVMRCLEKAPADRFANAGEVIGALMELFPPRTTLGSRSDVRVISRSKMAPAIRRKQKLSMLVPVAIVLLGLAIGAVLGLARRAKAPVVAAPSASVASSSRSRGVAITDHPPPKTSVPEAAVAYGQALQALRGASLRLAEDEMARAVKLDPSVAQAQLRASLELTGRDEVTVRREHLVAAEQLRADLDARDALILKVAEASLADPRNDAQVLERLRAVVAAFPDDAEASLMLGLGLANAGRLEEGRTELLRAFDLDPQFATAQWALATTFWSLHPEDPTRALACLTRCLEIAPAAGTCLRQRADLYLDRGDCAKVESDARTMTVVEPKGTSSYEFLAMALAAQGAPIEAVQEALRKRASLAAESGGQVEMTQEGALAVALLTGDMAEAEAEARRGLELVAGAQTESEHDVPMETLLDVLEERGATAQALAEAEAFEKREGAWTPDAPWGVHLRVAFMRYEAKKIDRATLTTIMDTLDQHAGAHASADSGAAAARMMVKKARLLTKPDQAASLLAQLSIAGLTQGGAFQTWSEQLQLALGRTLLLTDHPSDAAVQLRLAARSCGILTVHEKFSDLDVGDTIAWMHAHVLLGDALERTHDVPGACAAYAVVKTRWKDAKPRSVTLDKAKERSRALGCPEPG